MTVRSLALKTLNNVQNLPSLPLPQPQTGLSPVFLRWWHDGGPLWGIALGFLTIFIWLPAFRLLSLGIGLPGEAAWNGILQLWPHPAFLEWGKTLTNWGQGIALDNRLAAEGWLFALLLSMLMGTLSLAPARAAWRNNLQNNHALRGTALFLSSISFLLIPLALGWVGTAFIGYDTLTWSVAGILMFLTLAIAQTGIQCLWPSRLINANSLAIGAVIAIFAPWFILKNTVNVIWLGKLAQLPMAQFALLAVVFSCAWSAHHFAIYVSASFGNQKSSFDALSNASRGQLVALSLDCLHTLEQHRSLLSDTKIQSIAKELGIHQGETLFVFARLSKAGITALNVDRFGNTLVDFDRDLSTLTVYDVVAAMDNELRADSSITRKKIEDCLLYTAHVERCSLQINLLDLFHHRDGFDRLQARLCDSQALPLVNFRSLTEEKAKPLRSEESFPKNESYGPVDFDDPFWKDVTLEALSSFNNGQSEDVEISDFPPILDKAS